MASQPVYVPDFELEIGGRPIPAALRGAVTSISYVDGHQAADRVEIALANADLGPERAVSADLGVTLQGRGLHQTDDRLWRGWTVSAAGFWAVVDGAIANVTLPSGSVPGFTGTVRQRRNAGEAHARGVELDADVRPAGWLRLRASASLAESRFRESLEPPLAEKGDGAFRPPEAGSASSRSRGRRAAPGSIRRGARGSGSVPSRRRGR